MDYYSQAIHPVAEKAGFIEYILKSDPPVIKFTTKAIHAYFAGTHLQKLGLYDGLPGLGYHAGLKKVDKSSHKIVISMVQNAPSPLETLEELIGYDPILAARCVCGNLVPGEALLAKITQALIDIIRNYQGSLECRCVDAARELTRLQAAEAIPEIIQAARKAPTPRVRRKLLKKVSRFGAESLPYLIEELDVWRSIYFEYYIFDTLGVIADPKVIEIVRPYTEPDQCGDQGVEAINMLAK